MSGGPRRRRSVLLVWAVVSAGAAIGAAVTMSAANRSGSSAAVPIGLLVFTALLVFVVVVASREAKRKALERWSSSLAAAGLGGVELSAPGSRDAAFAPFAHLGVLRHGAKKLKFAGEGETDARRIVVAVHQFVISTGKSAQTITHTLAATPVPPAWPGLTIEPEHLGHRIAAAFGKRDILAGDPAFDRAWYVRADGGAGSEDFAFLLLGPEVQAYLLATPKRERESWHLGQGWLVCARKRPVKPAEFAAFARRPAELLDRVAEELALWEGTVPGGGSGVEEHRG